MNNDHEGHRQRLKERFLECGIDDFEPHNVLELLLFYAVPRKDTNLLAHDLINKFGSLSAVLDANPKDLMKVDGVGENTAAFLTMIPQVARKYFEDKTKEAVVIKSRYDLGKYLIPKYIGRTKEALMLVAMDNKNKILSCRIVSEGDVSSAQISKRKIMEEAIRLNAAKIALAHNHPSGILIASPDDIDMTNSIREMLSHVGITFYDHIIVANNDFVSMVASGVIVLKE